MNNKMIYNVKTEIKPGIFEEYVEDEIDINQEYLAIPRDILIDKKLKANEKMIMGSVISFTNNGREAFASNRLLGAILSLSPSRVSSIISGLVKKEYLMISMQRNSEGHVIRRSLFPNERFIDPGFVDDEE